MRPSPHPTGRHDRRDAGQGAADPLLRAAERALWQRSALVPGITAWQHDGLLAVRAEEPALAFRCTITGDGPVLDLLAAPVWGDARPTVITQRDLSTDGLTRVADRGLAIRRVTGVPAVRGVVESADFADVLLAGYEVDGPVAEHIRVEHELPAVRGFLLWDGDEPIAAAAMSVHGDVAVLGGAATLRAHRGTGAQSRLLRHRLHVAAGLGCALAVATVVPDSASAANLRRAGFDVRRRAAWVQDSRRA